MRKEEAVTSIKNGYDIIKMDETKITAEINIDENWKKNLLFMIYVNIIIGNITIDFLPTIFIELLKNLLEYKKLFVGSTNKDNEKIEREFIKAMLKSERKGPLQITSQATPYKNVVSFKKVEPVSMHSSGIQIELFSPKIPSLSVRTNKQSSEKIESKSTGKSRKPAISQRFPSIGTGRTEATAREEERYWPEEFAENVG